MTFPAWDSFDGDRRVKARHLHVYRWCRKNFDHTEIRDRKLETIAKESEVHLTQVSKVLDDLVAWGYLIEHESGRYRERRFTLAWSVRERVA